MSNNKHYSIKPQPKNALERLEELDKRVAAVEDFVGNKLVADVNNAVSALSKQAGGLSEVVAAIAKLVGEDAIKALVETARKDAELQRVASLKAAIAEMKANGQLVTSEKITEDSLVVGVEFEADGSETFPGFVQLQFSQFKPEWREKLLGAEVGAKIDTLEGRSFQVNEIFSIAAAKPEAAAV